MNQIDSSEDVKKDQVIVLYKQTDTQEEFGEAFGPFKSEQIALNWIEIKQSVFSWGGHFCITVLSSPDFISATKKRKPD